MQIGYKEEDDSEAYWNKYKTQKRPMKTQSQCDDYKHSASYD